MKNKINIAEILKNCPSGMELYSPLVGDCKFVKVHDYESKIIVELETGATVVFQTDGRYFDCPNAECILFPKGKTTWEGFQRPFKNGDIVFYSNTIAIFNEWGDETLFRTYCVLYTTVSNPMYQFEISIPLFGKGIRKEVRFATEEEKAKLFNAIKANGYKWNDETKTLEKLPKFKVGYKIKRIKTGNIYEITKILPNYYITKYLGSDIMISFNDQDEYKLVPSKFDINTLKHFDKVLVRNTNKGYWCGQFYMFYDENEEYPFTCTYNCWKQCIPYNEDTKHLTGTTDDCDEYFKIWE